MIGVNFCENSQRHTATLDIRLKKTLENIKKTLIISVEDEWYCIGVYDERQIEKWEKKNCVSSD